MRSRQEDINIASLTDEDLLADYQAVGDLHVLGVLYKRYMGLVYNICLKYLKTGPASEDAVMDIFEHLIEKARTHEIVHFKAWLAAVTRNHCLMVLRKAGVKIEISLDETFMQSGENLHQRNSMGGGLFTEGPGYEVKEQVMQTMERCIERLVKEQKKTVQLFYLQQKCYKEVAEITGYPIAKVRSYIQNGRRNLKICMEKQNLE